MKNSINNANQFCFFFRPQKNPVMGSKSDNVEIIMGIETDNIIKELFKSFLKNYQKNVGTQNDR